MAAFLVLFSFIFHILYFILILRGNLCTSNKIMRMLDIFVSIFVSILLMRRYLFALLSAFLFLNIITINKYWSWLYFSMRNINAWKRMLNIYRFGCLFTMRCCFILASFVCILESLIIGCGHFGSWWYGFFFLCLGSEDLIGEINCVKLERFLHAI